MEDSAIIDLYWARDQYAISASDEKYGALCRKLSQNILSSREDAEECVNDTWHRAWDTMPPQRPGSLRAYLAKIVRNLSISRWRKNAAQKRGGGRTEELLSELGECLLSPDGDPAAETEKRELTRSIDAWLSAQTEADRYLFLRRYWYGDPVQEIQRTMGRTGCAQRLHRLRLSLRSWLEKEGFSI